MKSTKFILYCKNPCINQIEKKSIKFIRSLSPNHNKRSLKIKNTQILICIIQKKKYYDKNKSLHITKKQEELHIKNEKKYPPPPQKKKIEENSNLAYVEK